MYGCNILPSQYCREASGQRPEYFLLLSDLDKVLHKVLRKEYWSIVIAGIYDIRHMSITLHVSECAVYLNKGLQRLGSMNMGTRMGDSVPIQLPSVCR